MSTVAVFALAGLLSWLLRASFIVVARPASSGSRLARTVRYAAPAALAAMTVTTVNEAAGVGGSAMWPVCVAAVVAAATARAAHNLSLTILVGTGVMALLTLAV